MVAARDMTATGFVLVPSLIGGESQPAGLAERER